MAMLKKENFPVKFAPPANALLFGAKNGKPFGRK
jgi:hypothetical protein